MADPIKTATRAANAYAKACRAAFKAGRVTPDVLVTYDAARRAFYETMDAEHRARFTGFHDFLACHDATPLSEIRADLA